MESGMTPMEGAAARRRALAKRAFGDELPVAELTELWDECEACAVEFGCIDVHASPHGAIGFPPPTACPGLCGALVRQLDLAGFGEEW